MLLTDLEAAFFNYLLSRVIKSKCTKEGKIKVLNNLIQYVERYDNG